MHPITSLCIKSQVIPSDHRSRHIASPHILVHRRSHHMTWDNISQPTTSPHVTSLTSSHRITKLLILYHITSGCSAPHHHQWHQIRCLASRAFSPWNFLPPLAWELVVGRFDFINLFIELLLDLKTIYNSDLVRIARK